MPGKPYSPGYQKGNHWIIDDVSGFAIRANDARKRWDNMWMESDDWEPRHPQDFVRARHDKIAPDAPVRPDDDGDEVFHSNLCPMDAVACEAIAGCAIAGLDQNTGEHQKVPEGTFNNSLDDDQYVEAGYVDNGYISS